MVMADVHNSLQGGSAVKAAWKSDKGKVRENNEDSVLADAEKGIFLLADGMGGHRGGEVASDLAVRTAYEFLREASGRTDKGGMPRLLADALAATHSAVFRKGTTAPGLAGMGTTLEMVVIKGAQAFVCHLGDSRVYLFRRESLRRVTTDDNYAAYLMEYEHVAEEDLPSGAQHILTQAVGASDELVPEIHTLELEEGDIITLCSDGLTGMVADSDIESALRSHWDDLEKAAAALVDEANRRGGFDNISVLLVRPEPPFSPSPQDTLLLTA